MILSWSCNIFEQFCEPICNFRAARFHFTKVFQQQGETIDTFYNRILKLARQCDFSDMNERMIDAIIFGTNCIKAQDKLLQTPRTLSLQQCITVCRHYKSLSLHIQQIRPDKHVEYLKKRHQKSKQNKAKPQQHGRSRSKSQGRRQPNQRDDTQFQIYSEQSHYKCRGCGKQPHKNWRKQCSAWGHFCKKCRRYNHYESVCGKIPKFSQKQDHTSVNELNQNHGNASTGSNTIPKQIVDVVNLTNSVDNLSQTYRKQLYLDTLDAEPKLPTSQSNPTEMFSNIEIEGILVCGKQDTGAEINAMPLNVYDQLNMKLNGRSPAQTLQ